MNDQSQNFDDAFIEAVRALDRKDYETAYKLFLPLAEQGHVDGQNNLGLLHLLGLGVPRDSKEAVKWIRLSAEQGDDFAQEILGSIYYEGKGISQDYKKAFKWWKLAAD